MSFKFLNIYAMKLYTSIYGVGLYMGHDEKSGLAYLYDLDGGKLCAIKLVNILKQTDSYRDVESADVDKAMEVAEDELFDVLGAEASKTSYDGWDEVSVDVQDLIY